MTFQLACNLDDIIFIEPTTTGGMNLLAGFLMDVGGFMASSGITEYEHKVYWEAGEDFLVLTFNHEKDATVFKMRYAEQFGDWPRPAPEIVVDLEDTVITYDTEAAIADDLLETIREIMNDPDTATAQAIDIMKDMQ